MLEVLFYFLRLKDNFFDSTIYEAQMEAIIEGMMKQRAESFDANIVSDVTEDLFANVDFPGSDLTARNIQRGRDHGLPGYNEYRKGTSLNSQQTCKSFLFHLLVFVIYLLYRKLCGMQEACSWSSSPAEIPIHLWTKLSTLYDSPSDIDLFSAGLAETQLNGAHVGPTFACIIGRQVNLGRLDRMSHRKWRETKQQPSRARSGHQLSCCLVSLHFLCDILSGRHVTPTLRKHFSLPTQALTSVPRL